MSLRNDTCRDASDLCRRVMLSGLVLLVFLICYCCHRNVNKNSERRSEMYWQEPLEVFTVDEQVSCPVTRQPKVQ
jgi:hypothetical protein